MKPKLDAKPKPCFLTRLLKKSKNPAQTRGYRKRARWDSNPRFWAIFALKRVAPKAHVLVLARLRAPSFLFGFWRSLLWLIVLPSFYQRMHNASLVSSFTIRRR